MDRYRPPHQELWEGRHDEGAHQRFHQIVQFVDLNDSFAPFHGHPVALIGFACDEGCKRNKGRSGSAEGPQAIRHALAKLPLPREDLVVVDAGNILCADGDMEKSQEALAAAVALLLKKGAFPLVLGGGHELAWGHYQGVKQASKHQALTIINFDAHYDMRPLIDNHLGSSGTSFLQIARERLNEKLPFHYTCMGIQEAGNTSALFKTAEFWGVKTVAASTIHLREEEQVKMKLKEELERDGSILLSICMDVFAAAYAPGVSAPQPLGLTPWQVIPLLQNIMESKKVLTLEISEVSPPFDIDGQTSKLAALLIFYLLQRSK